MNEWIAELLGQAFRTLKLLEQHHEKLSQLLKFQTSHPVPPKTDIPSGEVEAAPPIPAQPSAKAQDGIQHRPQSQSHPVTHRPQRDTSSSIAGTLASARGIPSNKQRRSGQPSSPAVAQQNAEGKIVAPPRRSKLAEGSSNNHVEGSTSEKPVATTHSPRREEAATQSEKAVPDDSKKPPEDAFNRFYTTFESLFSKLSAPLAFAGLPLNPDADDSTANDLASPTKPPSKLPASKSKQARPSNPRRATAEPAYSQLFSPAALAAVREEPGNAALGAPGESFYVVPTTGGTMPYASILARHQQHSSSGGHHHARSLSRDSTGLSEDIDEFVDARETPGMESPVMSRTRKGGSGGPNQKSMEELQLENESLRGVLDEMSRRLWQFEMGAQMGSVALHQSIRASLNRGPSDGTPAAASKDDGGGAAAAAAAEGRLAGVEEEMRRQKKEMERMGRENEKLKGVVGRYRERWEKLKEGARTRRAPAGLGGGGGDGGLEKMTEGEEI